MKWRLINYFDVWGNAEEGWEVNNQCIEAEDIHISDEATDKDICEYLVKYPEIRCFISEVGEEAIKRCKAGKVNDNEYTALYRKMNTVSYMMNSK